ncbi:hypothetical protein MHU86_17533 [Fragilaria crotonensis]|nr:hypothetical protein MHU86_17533 [Fragilaria crotonensis]
MKFGQHLRENIAAEYGPEPYIAYDSLDSMIRELSKEAPSSVDLSQRQVSLTMPPPTNAHGVSHEGATVTEEVFLKTMDDQMFKVEKFTLEQVTLLRTKLKAVEKSVDKIGNTVDIDTLAAETDEIAEQFLRLEKYVNINFMGFHKILKKHDKHVPGNPIKAFYVARMHGQAWVRGDYSDVVKTSTGESDSQMTNSVYLDNDQLELYHGRLDKSPGAIALRLRWYGAGDPRLVFCERKTHREKWTGEVSVKERFTIDESEVQSVMTNTYPIEDKRRKMMQNGKSQKEADEWETLVRECTQVISSKQLVPTMRTQYMRTAFQIPFDATVRVSLDTNLCMISERGYNLDNMKNWHRDPSEVLARNEITRFPHAVLEVKLELKGENLTPPKWVTDLQNSGMLYEVHKFSKFIHGCAVLLPEDVRSVPYWVDDASIRDSIIASEGSAFWLMKTKVLVPVQHKCIRTYCHLAIRLKIARIQRWVEL